MSFRYRLEPATYESVNGLQTGTLLVLSDYSSFLLSLIQKFSVGKLSLSEQMYVFSIPKTLNLNKIKYLFVYPSTDRDDPLILDGSSLSCYRYFFYSLEKIFPYRLDHPFMVDISLLLKSII